MKKYLALPGNISKRVRDFAAEVTSEAQNPYDKARAIETFLRSYPYTLDVPKLPEGREIADYFLFELKTGYCDYYATSMVVLARAAGLPARMVIGYAGNEYDFKNAQYIVREVHAHSWVEIYFPGIGWIEFEPTASQPPIQRPPTPEETDLSINIAPAQTQRTALPHGKLGHFVKKSPFGSILFMLLAIAAASLWYLHMQGLWFSYTTIGSIYAYIYHHGRKIYRNASLDETPSRFAERLKARLRVDHRFLQPAPAELDQLTRLYLQETYSPHPVSLEEREQAVQIWRKLIWRLLYARFLR